MKITNELYEKEYWNDYIEFIETNKENITVDDMFKFQNIDIDDCNQDNTKNVLNYEYIHNDIDMLKNITIIQDLDDGITYFKLKDIQKQLYDAPYDVNDICFIVNNNSFEKELFLTYRGMLKVLFTSRTGKANTFIDWAMDTLFTAQMGTREQKIKLASKTLGVTAETIKEVFNITASTIPCIYLFVIGTVSMLRKSMMIPYNFADDCVLLKYGFTDNLKRRTLEHEKYYSKIKGTDLKLKNWSYIDPQYISAKTDIREHLKLHNNSFEFDNQEELIILPQKSISVVEKEYKKAGELYGGHIKEMTSKIKELETKLEMIDIKHQLELSFKDKSIELKDKDLELKDKDIYILTKEKNILEREKTLLEEKYTLDNIDKKIKKKF